MAAVDAPVAMAICCDPGAASAGSKSSRMVTEVVRGGISTVMRSLLAADGIAARGVGGAGGVGVTTRVSS
jgi:hypothetical protein